MAQLQLSLAGVAKLIASGSCRSIGVLTGAGVSVASGIPDFRSPGGMYDTLRPELLTATEEQREMMRANPTAVVSTRIFMHNAFPYLELRRPFILGTAENQWKATLTHFFIKLLCEKGLLTRLYTQNIDGLDYQLELPDDKIIPVHGTIGTYSCEFCHTPMPREEFRALVRSNIKDIYGIDPSAPAESSPINCGGCGKAGVKPDTVLYGGMMPERFIENAGKDTKEMDLLIVMGTSLVVSPANSLVSRVSESCVRLIINNELVGAELGVIYDPAESERDVMALGSCDEVVMDLVRELGWVEELRVFRDKFADKSVEVFDARA